MKRIEPPQDSRGGMSFPKLVVKYRGPHLADVPTSAPKAQ